MLERLKQMFGPKTAPTKDTDLEEARLRLAIINWRLDLLRDEDAVLTLRKASVGHDQNAAS